MPEPGKVLSAGTDPRKYMQLAALLRGRIQDGILRPGDPAPSITALAAEHGGWARQTCAKAFRILEGEGFMYRVPGLGYFITSPASREDTDGTRQPPVLPHVDRRPHRPGRPASAQPLE